MERVYLLLCAKRYLRPPTNTKVCLKCGVKPDCKVEINSRVHTGNVLLYILQRVAMLGCVSGES